MSRVQGVGTEVIGGRESPREVADAIRAADRFVLTTHENPDGDALGSLLALHQMLAELDKDSVMFLAAKEFPLPVEYRFLHLEEVFHEPPADLVDRVVVFLDCGNIDRMPVDWLQQGNGQILNVDHHHDNTRFGDVNLVDTAASSTAEIVFGLGQELGVELTREIASALYVGLVTDTGRFSYENTRPASHRMAAELIESGVDVADIYRRLYERVPIEKLRLVSRALAKATVVERRRARDHLHHGRATIARPGRTRPSPRGSSTICGASRAPRSPRSSETKETGPATCKVSLRSVDGSVDVSRIARQVRGWGPPARRRVLDRPRLPRAGRVPLCRASEGQPESRRTVVRQARGGDVARRRGSRAP